MSRSLTASDRRALIRLASTMEKGSGVRRAILSGLKAASEELPFDRFYKIWNKIVSSFELHIDI